MVYASSGVMKCYECGHVWREKITCPYREQEAEVATAAAPSLLLYVEAGTTTLRQIIYLLWKVFSKIEISTV